MMAGISSLVRNDPPALLSCLGHFVFRSVGCDPREESLLLLPAAATDVSVRVARSPPCRWLAAPRRELRVVVAGFAGIATAGWGCRPLPLPRRVLISGSSIRCRRKMCPQEYVSGGHIGPGYSVLPDKFA